MFTRSLFPLLILYIEVSAFAAPTQSALKLGRSQLKLATRAEGANLLATRDRFVATLSPFDRAARLKSATPISEDTYLKFVSGQTLEWSSPEYRRLAKIVNALDHRLATWQLPLPNDLLLIKTTGKEEGGAAYCRQNAIVLPAAEVGNSDADVEKLLTHELFHIVSRNAPALRDLLYELLGFSACSEVPFPVELSEHKITNPDAPFNDHQMELRPGVHVAPILFSSSDYSPERGGEFFEYLTFKLLLLDRAGKDWRPRLVEGKAQFIDSRDETIFVAKMGRNTQYVIHPEEVLADNFVFVVQNRRDVPNVDLLDEIAKRLPRAK